MKKVIKDEAVKAVEAQILRIADAEPGVAQNMLKTIPNFNKSALDVLSAYEKTLESVKECQRVAVIGHLMTISSLQEMLKDENLTFEQKMWVIYQMKEVAEKVDEVSKTFLDTIKENWKSLLVLAAVAVVGGAEILSNKDDDDNDSNAA